MDNTFTIGVRNAYARDWLESRLSSTATRLLMGIMNQDIDIQFVVSSDRDRLPVLEEETISNSHHEQMMNYLSKAPIVSH